jgi:hypothetical protein
MYKLFYGVKPFLSSIYEFFEYYDLKYSINYLNILILCILELLMGV